VFRELKERFSKRRAERRTTRVERARKRRKSTFAAESKN
jgi:hypothetical protein